ncbi:hypothetical protein [Ornithinibacillus californiensis]|uniref:hypothetical protein n=1 Tax=Ornithinibacillus californiensis TaxID=161536 RepID=UPI00064D74B6|nr:hypothetical protein [Ornithinibacillus californiensis]
MNKESSNRGPWLIILFLSVVLIVGLILNQPMTRDKVMERAKDFVSDDFEVVSTLFIPMNENELGADLWEVELMNDEEDKAILTINAQSENLVYGRIEDGKTGEILEEL